MKANWVSVVLLGVLSLGVMSCSSKGPTSIDEYFHRAINEQRALINQHITDERVHRRCMKQMERMDVLLREFAPTLKKQAADIDAMMLNYETTAQEFKEVGDAFEAEHDAFLSELLDIRHELRVLMSQDEWAKTSRRQYKILGY